MTICLNETPVCGKVAKCLIFSDNWELILYMLAGCAEKVRNGKVGKEQGESGEVGASEGFLGGWGRARGCSGYRMKRDRGWVEDGRVGG